MYFADTSKILVADRVSEVKDHSICDLHLFYAHFIVKPFKVQDHFKKWHRQAQNRDDFDQLADTLMQDLHP